MVIEILKFVILAFIILLPFRWFVAQPFIVSGTSMIPAFKVNEYLIIDKITYDFKQPERGDVIVFHYPLDPAIFFIKRNFSFKYYRGALCPGGPISRT